MNFSTTIPRRNFLKMNKLNKVFECSQCSRNYLKRDEMEEAYTSLKEKMENDHQEKMGKMKTEIMELKNSLNDEKNKISFQNLLENIEPCKIDEISLPLILPTLTLKKNMRNSSDEGFKVGFKN